MSPLGRSSNPSESPTSGRLRASGTCPPVPGAAEGQASRSSPLSQLLSAVQGYFWVLPGDPSRDAGAAGGNRSGLFETSFRKDGSFKEFILLKYAKGLPDIQSSEFMSAIHFLSSKVLLRRIWLAAERTFKVRGPFILIPCSVSVSPQYLHKILSALHYKCHAWGSIKLVRHQIKCGFITSKWSWMIWKLQNYDGHLYQVHHYSRKSLTVGHVSA